MFKTLRSANLRFHFVVCLLASMSIVGCGGGAATEVTDDVAETAADYVANVGENAADAADAGSQAGNSEVGNTDQWAVPATTTADTSAGTVDGEVVTGDLDVPPAEPTLESFAMQIQQALQTGNVDAAISAAKDARAKLPDDPRTLIVIANMGGMLAQSGDIDGGLALLEEYPESQTDKNMQMVLLQLYQAKSESLVDSDLPGALAMAQKSNVIVRDLGEGQPWAGNFIYGEAVLLAKSGAAAESLAVLREAFDAGFSEVAMVTDEEAFSENEDVTALVGEFAAKIAERNREAIREEMAKMESYPFAFELTTVDGEPITTDSLKGKIAIVDFWGTWCPPCRMEIPHFIKLGETYSDDLVVVGLNYQEPGDTEDEQATHIKKFMESQNMTYQCAVGNDATIEQIPRVEGFPTTLFLDRSGKVRLQLVGYHPYERLEAAVLELIEEAAPAESADANTTGDVESDTANDDAAES